MSIEKMMLASIHGLSDNLGEVMTCLSDLCCFQPEPASELVRGSRDFTAFEQENPYSSPLKQVEKLAAQAGIPLEYRRPGKASPMKQDFLDAFQSELASLAEKRDILTEEIRNHENVLTQLHHIEAIDVSLDDVFSCRFIQVRFGRLPADSYTKLDYYNEEMFFFVPFERDKDYYWGAYFTTEEFEPVADSIMGSLFFERIRIPDYVHGTPKTALSKLEAALKYEKAELMSAQKELSALADKNRQALLSCYCDLKFRSECFDLRRFVAVSTEGARQLFYLVGFVPKREEQRLRESLEKVPDVTVTIVPGDSDKRFTPPTRLKNNWFARPFEMFVSMYGMPGQHDIDPTPFVALTYTLLFGVMFGDVGQGLVIALAGLFFYRKWGMQLGQVMERIGVSSALFGLAYGSVFGFEHLLDPVYHALGFAKKPVEVMDGATINQILLVAVGAGVVMLLASMLINLIQGVKQKSLARAVLDANGLCGITIYCAVLGGVAGMLLGVALFSPLYVVFLILLPVLLLILKEPILHLLAGESPKPEEGIGGYLAESVFELFEIFLSFATNTMSFLRVGGFVLSHAGMMLVVNTLSEMVGAGAGPIVIVLGNVFVLCLEGLIVGIQVLRLEFYEMFSRFFSGEGLPFEPASLGTDSQKA